MRKRDEVIVYMDGKNPSAWKIIFLLVVLSFVGACLFSIGNDWRTFFSISFAQALTIIVAVGIAYFATQRRYDERKSKEQIGKIVYKIEDIVTDKTFYKFSCDEDPEVASNRINMTMRKRRNYISIMQQYLQVSNVKEEVDYIYHEFCTYRDAVSEKIGDMEYLANSEEIFKMHALNIESKCDQIIAKLY